MLTIPYAGDWKYFTNRRTLSYEVKTSNAPNTFATPATVTDCVRNAPERADVELLADCDAVFHCWAEKLGGIVPKPGDRVTEGGVAYDTLRVQVMDEGNRYRLTCKKGR